MRTIQASRVTCVVSPSHFLGCPPPRPPCGACISCYSVVAMFAVASCILSLGCQLIALLVYAMWAFGSCEPSTESQHFRRMLFGGWCLLLSASVYAQTECLHLDSTELASYLSLIYTQKNPWLLLHSGPTCHSA